MKWHAMLSKQGTKWRQIKREQERTKSGALRYPLGEDSSSTGRIVHHDTETPIRDVGPEQLQSRACNVHPLLQYEAAAKSKSTSKTQFPEFIALNMLLNTFKKADLVL
ncbi:hypothetical protein XENORESO_008553 [Xenotaenia resolanae]|uniref:Uncharacterized protein n=1 Tax=Xenotaenia resolanae TaxID=208358 RepID=A0ABV0VSH1_9TELE